MTNNTQDTLLEPSQLGPSSQFLRADELRRGFEFMMLAQRSLYATQDTLLSELGLGPAHSRALFLIKQHEGLRVSDLQAFLSITKQSLARVLDSLEKEDLITRTADPVDGRVRRITLTTAGEKLERSLFDKMAERLSRAYGAVGQQAVGSVWQMLLYVMDQDLRTLLFKEPTKR